MKYKTKQRILSIVMALLMAISLLPTDFAGGNVVVKAEETVIKTMSLGLTADNVFVKDTTANENAVKEINSNFTLQCHKNSYIHADQKTYGADADAKTFEYSLSTGGTAKTNAASVKFATENKADITIYWYTATAGRFPVVLDSNGTKVAEPATADQATEANTNYVTKLSVASAGTYYVGAASSSINISEIVVEEKGEGSGDPTPTKYAVKVSVDDNTAGTVSANPQEAAENETVTITATANADYQFKEWVVVSPASLTLTSATSAETTFTMPASEVEVKATFEAKTVDPQPPVDDTIVEKTYDFIKDGYADMDAINAVKGLSLAGFTKHADHGVQTDANNGGTITLNLAEQSNITITECMYGSVVPTAAGVEAQTVTEYAYKSVDGVYQFIAAPAGEFVITIPAGTSYVHSIKVEKNTGTQHGITVTPADNGTVTAPKDKAYAGEIVKLTVTPAEGYQLKEWEVTPAGLTVSTDGKFTMPDEDVTVKAVFDVKKDEPPKTIANGDYNLIGAKVATLAIDGLTLGSGIADDTHSHGLEVTTGGTITLNLAAKSNITVTECMYGTVEVESSSGTVENIVKCVTPVNNSGGVDGVYKITGAEAGEVTLTFASGSGFIHSIKVEKYKEITDIEPKPYDFVNTEADAISDIPGLFLDGFTKHYNAAAQESHGITSTGGTITIYLAEQSDITISECKYGSVAPTGTIVPKDSDAATAVDIKTVTECETGKVAAVYKVVGAPAGKLELSFSGQVYIHSINVEKNTKEKRTITVTTEGKGTASASPETAFAGDTVTVTAKPNTQATFKGWTSETADVIFADASSLETTFVMPDSDVSVKATFEGGLEEKPISMTKSNDFDFTKAFTALTAVDGTSTLASGQTIVLGKLNSSGVGDGGGHVKFRSGNMLLLPLTQADTTKVVVRMICSQENATRYITVGDDPAGVYQVPVSLSEKSVTVPDIDEFVVTKGDVRYLPVIATGEVKAYHIYIDEYNPVNSVTVSGTVTGAADNNITEIKFKNLTDPTKEPVTATINADGTYSVVLKRIGETTYAASVPKVGFKIDDTDGADVFTLTGNAATFPKDFSVTTAAIATISGTLTGIPDEAVIGGAFSAKLVPVKATLDAISLTLTKTDAGYTFADVIVVAGEDYTVELTNADDYEVTEKVNKAEGTHADVTIAATAKATVDVSGSFVTSDRATATVTTITFTNKETPDYKYTGTVSGNTYTAKLRAGEYTTSVEAEGYTAYDSVSVKDAAVTNDVYLEKPADTSEVAYKETVTVGSGQEFEKIADALKYVARMPRPNGERVTLLLTDSTYREQLLIDIPNITIKSEAGATLTWYYGVGYTYYSAKLGADNKALYYDEAYAVDKYTLSKPIEQSSGHWGATVNLLSGATGFKAENITFENSFNRYMTTEEVADGVTPTGSLPARAAATDADVLTKAFKERACVIYIQADQTEYKNCKFLSSQDTIYTGDADEHSYFVNCKIEGTTDYICGDGNPVFDKCTLSMYSYSDQEAKGSYIVANKAKATHGYLFNNCSIVSTTDANMQATSNNILARAWDAGKVKWYNTLVESDTMLAKKAYADMNASVSNAHYEEYNTHLADGTTVTTNEGITTGVTIHTEDPNWDVKTFFGSWEPTFYVVPEYTVTLATDGLTGATAELDIAADAKVKEDAKVTVTITPEEGKIFATAPEVAVTGATKGEVTKAKIGNTYTCEITGFTADATVTVTGTAEEDTRQKYSVDFDVDGLGVGASAETPDVRAGVYADDVITVTIKLDAHKVFTADPTVTADNATAGNVTKNSDGTYTCDVTGFTAHTTITIAGTVEDEPSYSFSLDDSGLTDATATSDTETTAKVYSSDTVTITITPIKGNMFETEPTVTAEGATVGTLTELTGGAYSVEITGFTKDTTIVVAGSTVVAPSITSHVLLGDNEDLVSSGLTAAKVLKSDDGYFTLGIKGKITDNEKTYADGTHVKRRIQTGAKIKPTADTGLIKFTTTKPAVVTIHANQSGGSTGEVRTLAVYNVATGAQVGEGLPMAKGTLPDPYVLVLTEPGTYAVGAAENGIDIYRIEVKEGTTTPPAQIKATLNVENLKNATAKLSKSIFTKDGGDTVLTITPAEGAAFETKPAVTATVGTVDDGTLNEEGKYVYTISGITADTTITVTGEAKFPEYDVTLDKTGLTGATAVADKEKASSKDEVVVTITPDAGKEFKTAPTVTLKTEGTATVGAVTKAADSDAYTCKVTNVTAATELVVAGEAVEKKVIVKVTVENDGNGTATAGKTEVEAGATVELTATPNAGYVFNEWVVTGEGASVADSKAATTTLTVGSVDVTVKATFAKQPDLTQIKAFVERLYNNILGRAGDEEGVNTWTTLLANREVTGAAASNGFVFSDEFINKGLTNEQKVEIFYETFLNRTADEGGKQLWVSALDAGVDLEKIFEGFVMSDEFAGICDSYGIAVGSMSDIPGMTDILNRYRNRNIPLAQFVSRCYTKALGRPGDVPGIDSWCANIIEGFWTPRNVAADGFFHSDEFIAKNTTNAEYVSILYQTFLGRELDADGYTMWVGLLDRGEWTRDQVLDGFADSDEFKAILASFGLNNNKMPVRSIRNCMR